MTSNRIKFENSYFNSLCNEHFSDTEDERDPDENLFNKANKQNLKCSYLFPNQVENFLSEKESSETINAIHVNIRSLWTYFDKLLGILDSNCSFNFLCITEIFARIQPLRIIQICIYQALMLFHKKEKQTSSEVVFKFTV